MYIRVKDPGTGHEYDLPEGHRLISEGKVTVVDGYAASHLQRPPKYSVGEPGPKPKPAPKSRVRKPRARKPATPKTPAVEPDQSAPTGTPDAN